MESLQYSGPRSKEKKRLEIHLHKCSLETLTLGWAAATRFGGGTASSSPTQPLNEQKQSPNKVEGAQKDLVTTNNKP